MATKVMECDLVVLGAGGSGLVAAVKAFDLTKKKVIVLEKAKRAGGATTFAGGMGETGPITDSTWQKEAGHTVSETQDISGQWFDWLVEKGAPRPFSRWPSRKKTKPSPYIQRPVWTSIRIFPTLPSDRGRWEPSWWRS
jgi:succinate dehydrogenase/fumarate reductase flavoprotein subunit